MVIPEPKYFLRPVFLISGKTADADAVDDAPDLVCNKFRIFIVPLARFEQYLIFIIVSV